MRTPTDIALSLQRYVSVALPEPWNVLTELENEIPERPYALVGLDDEPSTDGLINAPELVVPVTVYAYPSPPATRKLAAREAEQWAEALWTLFAMGKDPGRPMMLPLYRYDGRDEVQQITITGATAGTFALEHDGHVAAALPRRCQPRWMREALEALPSIGAGNVEVRAQRITGPWQVVFTGALAATDVAAITVDGSALTGPDVEAIAEVLVSGSPTPWHAHADFARIDRLSAGQTADLSDPRQRTVRARMRLTWARGAPVPSPDMLLQRIKARPA